jgi:riboflavin synthase
MFSGIVEEVGRVLSYDRTTLIISARAVLADLKPSDSINVSGACLTVVSIAPDNFIVQTVPETVLRTNFGRLKPGSLVNLERALTLGARIGGHMVQGHVDATGSVRTVTPDGNSLRVAFSAPANIIRYVVPKGFIAVDGVSLTVVERLPDGFTVVLIPYTRDHTAFAAMEAGDAVNLEADVTAKYIEQLAAPYLARQG